MLQYIELICYPALAFVTSILIGQYQNETRKSRKPLAVIQL